MRTYLLGVVPGLARVVVDEVRENLAVSAAVVGRLRNAEILTCQLDDDPAGLLGMRTVEDVFVSVGRMKLSGKAADLKALERSQMWGASLREAVSVWSEAQGKPAVKRQVFRVVTQADDMAWRTYRRSDIGLAAERAVISGSSWRLNREAAPLEIWLQQVEHELWVSVRLSTGEMRQHGGRNVEREAALRPSVAAAMVWLTQPADDDVFLDPMCGSGTVLLERAMAGRHELFVGGDADQGAVDATLANFGPRHQPRRIERWDATELPLVDNSVSKIACNLPWGRQVSEKAALPPLYAGMLAEAARVLRPGGRMVLLTSEWNLLNKALDKRTELELEATISNVEILGRRADIFVCTAN